MPKNRENQIFNNGLAECQEALEYKSSGAFEKAIELLQEIITKIEKEENSLEKVHLIGIVQKNLGIIYMDTDNIQKALYSFNKAILNFEIVLKEAPTTIGIYKEQISIFNRMATLYHIVQEEDKAFSYSDKAIIYYKKFKLSRSI